MDDGDVVLGLAWLTIWPGDVLPSAKVSSIVVAPATTWRLVRMSPAMVDDDAAAEVGLGLAIAARVCRPDEDQRRQDDLVDLGGQRRSGRDRGEGTGHLLVDVGPGQARPVASGGG